MAKCQCLLTENGGHLVFRDQWAKNILNEIMRTEKKMVITIATAWKIPVAPRLLKKEKFLHFKEKSRNLLLGIEFRKNWLIAFIRCLYPILLSVILHLSFLVCNQCLLREKEKENQLPVLLVLLPQVILCPCSSFTLWRLNTVILKVSHLHIDLMWYTQKTTRAKKSWLSSILITSSFRTLKWYKWLSTGSEMSSHLWCFQSTNNRKVLWAPWREQYCIRTSTTNFDPYFLTSRAQF